MKQNISLIINPSEITAGTRGASLGPGAMMAVARSKGSSLFGDFPITQIKDVNFLLDKPIKNPFAKRGEGLVEIFTLMSQEIQSTLANNQFPLVIAGDHGSAGGTIAGIKAQFPDKRLGVVWIDAHGDLHTPYTTPSGNMHGMPLATALNEDNKQEQRNNISENEIQIWNALKNAGNSGQKIASEDLVFIAVRDVEKEEIALMERLNIKNFTVEELRRLGVNAVLDAISTKLSACDLIYVSFDVDSMDPTETSHGTGTPVDHGLTIDEARNLLIGFTNHPKLVCMEFVEVNPCLDEKTNKMAEVAFDLFNDVVTSLRK